MNSRDELTPVTRDALRRAVAAGIYVVLATGRRYGRVLHLVEPIGIEMPLVTASGALVKDARDHRTLHRAEFDEDALRGLLSFMDEQGHAPILSADSYAEGFEFYYRDAFLDRPELAEFLERNTHRCRRWEQTFDTLPPAVFAGFVMGTPEEMRALGDEIHRRWPGVFYTHVLKSPRYEGFLCEFMPAGTTKWAAIELLAGDWGIGHEQICAVGDDVNDIDMIREAGLGVAMGNALPPVKAVADRIAPGHDEDGVAAVVEWILK
jgi:Cof subfamily protein (haloacid dehalogenase superfamily)